jgi:anti-sigma regulatory factor (Ser/Thr protein kinase)
VNGDGADEHTLLDEAITVGSLGQLRRRVLRLARQAGLAPERAEGFAIAVNETATNVIRHAGGAGELAVVQDDERCLIAEISDNGPGMPLGVTPRLPAPEATSGRGLWLTETLADRVVVDTSQRGTTVRLEMDLDPASPMSTR